MAKISIENFQSIKKVDFEIKGFTVIIGKNNIGKSAVIRAIEAALDNQTGKNFIKKGEKKTRIIIDHKDLNIEWEKNKTTASYKIKGHKEPFTKLKGAVPKPITDAGFQKMQLGDQKVFPLIASQFDPLFLINKPGPVVTEVLANLYQIDTLSIADNLCQKVIKSDKSLLKTRESDLKGLQENLEKYKDFEEIKKTVASLVEKEDEIENLKKEIDLIKSYEAQLKILVESLSRLRAIKDIAIPEKTECGEVLSELPWLQETDNKLRGLIITISKLKGISKIKIPKKVKCEKILSELPWLQEIDPKYQRAISITNNLKNISTIEIPKDTGCVTVLSEVQWLQENSAKYNTITSLINKLKGVIKIKTPKTQKIETLLKEVLLLQNWDKTVKKTTGDIRQQEGILKSLNLDKIIKSIENASSIIDDLERIKFIEKEFLAQIKILKHTQNNLSATTKEHEKINKEMKKFIVCPLCERPLCQNS